MPITSLTFPPSLIQAGLLSATQSSSSASFSPCPSSLGTNNGPHRAPISNCTDRMPLLFWTSASLLNIVILGQSPPLELNIAPLSTVPPPPSITGTLKLLTSHLLHSTCFVLPRLLAYREAQELGAAIATHSSVVPKNCFAVFCMQLPGSTPLTILGSHLRVLYDWAKGNSSPFQHICAGIFSGMYAKPPATLNHFISPFHCVVVISSIAQLLLQTNPAFARPLMRCDLAALRTIRHCSSHIREAKLIHTETD